MAADSEPRARGFWHGTRDATTWTLDLGYDGATIASTHTTYGTLRFNAPAGSYPRFNLYTSTSLPLPFFYRKAKQNEAAGVHLSLLC